MNKKQWYIFGIGFILMSIILSIFGSNGKDCSELSELSTKMKLIENMDIDADTQLLSCYIEVNMKKNISFAFLGLGILFLICSSLEAKQKY